MNAYKYHLFFLIFTLLHFQADVDGNRYTFEAEWFDIEASIVRPFYLFYFPVDETLELFDRKNNRVFLRRTKCEGISLKDINVGSTIKIFARSMFIKDFGDAYTRKQLGQLKQKTFAMLKPDVIDKCGEILELTYKEGFQITHLKMVKLSREETILFYEEHRGKQFLPDLVEYVSSGPVIVMELVAPNAIKKWREFIGPTNPLVAREQVPHTLRAKFGRDVTQNGVHGSDSPESAERELSLFFSTPEKKSVLHAKLSPAFRNCTCCIVKPHAIHEGNLGAVIAEIQKKGFKITAMQMFYLDYPNAEEFLEVYKGVIPEYSGMVSQLVSGPCVAMEICTDEPDTPVKFREFAGPPDPDIARQLRPDTLRAKFGKNKLMNAVHCSDLPEDGLLEVEYFFRILQ